MNGSIRFAKKQDIPALCEIWKNCFSDSEEYVRHFYKRNFERIKVLAYFIDEKPVSMINLMDSSFESKTEKQKALFIYATGTLKEHRKNGYMGILLNELTKKAKDEKLALFLKPSSPDLISYYKKFGFECGSCFRIIKISSEEKQTVSFTELSYEEYNLLRETAFSDIPHAKWDNAHIQWCLEENELFSGKALKAKLGSKDYFLLAYPNDKTLVIDETNLSPDELKSTGACLCDIFKTELIAANLPEHSCEEGEKSIPNLIFNSKINNPYINMILS